MAKGPSIEGALFQWGNKSASDEKVSKNVENKPTSLSSKEEEFFSKFGLSTNASERTPTVELAKSKNNENLPSEKVEPSVDESDAWPSMDDGDGPDQDGTSMSNEPLSTTNKLRAQPSVATQPNMQPAIAFDQPTSNSTPSSILSKKKSKSNSLCLVVRA